MNNLALREVDRNSGILKDFSHEQIDLIKQTVCKGATDAELQFFLCVCVKTGLDPFMKQIYSIPRAGQRTIQVSIDGSRSIADRTNKYMPGKKPTYAYNNKGELFSATAYVKKMASDGSWHEVEGEALFSEYNPGNNPIWKKMPHTMLSKCAEAIALRKAFPSHLSGIYAKEELHQAEVDEIAIEDKLADVKQLYINKTQALEIAACIEMLDTETKENFFGYLERKCKTRMVDLIPAKDFDHIIKLLQVRLEAGKKVKEKEQAKEENVTANDIQGEIE
jgi:phage recombination protein Bet